MARRLFLGIPLPEELVEEVAGICAGLDSDCDRVRWTKKENLHVTVLFLGDVEDEQYAAMIPRLEDVFSHAHQLALAVSGVTSAPSHRSPNMIWLDFKPSVGFAAICTAVREAVEDVIELKSAHGESKPHVTLARFRDGVPMSCQKTAKSIEYSRTFVAQECVLYESELSSDGPTYYELRSFKLES